MISNCHGLDEIMYVLIYFREMRRLMCTDQAFTIRVMKFSWMFVTYLGIWFLHLQLMIWRWRLHSLQVLSNFIKGKTWNDSSFIDLRIRNASVMLSVSFLSFTWLADWSCHCRFEDSLDESCRILVDYVKFLTSVVFCFARVASFVFVFIACRSLAGDPRHSDLFLRSVYVYRPPSVSRTVNVLRSDFVYSYAIS